MSKFITGISLAGKVFKSPEVEVFVKAHENYGPVSNRQGLEIGATAASILLGPDVRMPDEIRFNPPQISGSVWDTVLGGNRPETTFRQDRTYRWDKAMLLCGQWNCSGKLWNNIIPVTETAFNNHETVEEYINEYLEACYQFELDEYREIWYGLFYGVVCSEEPFSEKSETSDTNLYSYAPKFFKISWRAITITKPITITAEDARQAMETYTINPVEKFPKGLELPEKPGIMHSTTCISESGNPPGGALIAELPSNFPEAQDNGFDGDVEVHQA